MVDVFVIDLNNYDMILGIQWLVMLENVVSDYKELWMYFTWPGQEVVLTRDRTTKLQIIMFKQLNGLLDNPSELIEVSLCSLIILEEADNMTCSMLSTLPPIEEKNTALKELLKYY